MSIHFKGLRTKIYQSFEHGRILISRQNSETKNIFNSKINYVETT